MGGYLSPGPSQQTNLRMHALLMELLDRGFRIQVEDLGLESAHLNGFGIESGDLANKHVRHLLESLFIVYYQRQGYAILNR